ncbi:MAG: hypothetical protein ACHQ2Z_09760 [Elusimicrobiota bacterium]
MNNSIKLVPLAALLGAFFFAGCAAGGGGYGAMSKQDPSSSGSPCPPNTVFQNGQCVAYRGGK